MIFVAGHGGQVDDNGKSLAGDFDAQTRQTFRNLEATLKRAGASLRDLVTMTVFITDSRYGKQFTDIRLELFKDDFPASALITCDGLARTDMLVEVQGQHEQMGLADPAVHAPLLDAFGVAAKLP